MFDLFKRTNRHEQQENVNPADAARERALEEVADVIRLLAAAQTDLQTAARVAQSVLRGRWAEDIGRHADSVENIHMALDHQYEDMQRRLS
ncbi:hypothetical protein [Promicromonospora sp. NPDC059942]|uniref:hypothetical protein n=1 Tax=Promicromonospora sp. NPDC059942 TaxID=3347009 RepID=UPI003648BAB9